MIGSRLSQTINILRLPLAILVVAAHANILKVPLHTGRMAVDGKLVEFNYDIIQFPIHILSQILYAPSVPLFFIISGFLFFNNIDIFSLSSYKNKLFSRLSTLLIPYIIWNTLYFLIYLAFKKDVDCNLFSYFKSLIIPPIDPPLWFIRDLGFLYLFSPFIWFVLKKPFIYLQILFLLVILYVSDLGGINHYWSVIFFSLGGYFSVNNVFIQKYLGNKKLMNISLVLFVILGIFDLFTVHYSMFQDGSKIVTSMIRYDMLFKLLAILGCYCFSAIVYNYVEKLKVVGGGVFGICKSLAYTANNICNLGEVFIF